jgi:hypothetical protein
MRTIEILLELDDETADYVEEQFRDGVPIIICPQDAQALFDCAPFVFETYIPGEPTKYDTPQEVLARNVA